MQMEMQKMTLETLEQLFEKHNDEFLHFERIGDPNQASQSPDVNAMLLLLTRYPKYKGDAITRAKHE